MTDQQPAVVSAKKSEYLQRRNWRALFNSSARRWWLFCAAVVGTKLILLLLDPTMRPYSDGSLNYLRAAAGEKIPDNVCFLYVYPIRFLCMATGSFLPVVATQLLLSAWISLIVTRICRTIFNLAEWFCYVFGFLCLISPLEVTWERDIQPDTIVLFCYALLLYTSFVYLRRRGLTSLVAAQALAVIVIAFRNSFLIPFGFLTGALPILAFASEAKTEHRSSWNARFRFIRNLAFWQHLAISFVSFVAFTESYKLINGWVSQREPAYGYGSGYSLLAAWAPALRPEDSPDPRLAQILRDGSQFKLTSATAGNAQRVSRYLIDRWRRVETDDYKANVIAKRSAFSALCRDPVAIVKIAAKTYYEFWRGMAMERLVDTDLAGWRLTKVQEKTLAERYHWREVPDIAGERLTMSRQYYAAGIPYYFAILLSPLLSVALLFVARVRRYSALLFFHTSFIFVTTFLLSLAPAIRTLQLLSILMLLSAALSLKVLYPSLSEAGEKATTLSGGSHRGRHQVSAILAIVAVAAVLRFGLAGNQPLWTDEVFTLAMATGHSLEHAPTAANPALGDFVQLDRPQSVEELRRYMQHDNPPAGLSRVIRTLLISDTHPPLYYFAVYGWTLLFGTGDFALRALSIICSLACVPIIAGIARRVSGRKGVVPSCLLFAFCPLAISYSTEGRMYSLLWVWVLAVTWVSLVWTERGQSILLAAGWVLASAAGFLTHYFFVFPWTALVMFLLVRPQKLSRLQLVTCLAAMALVILPWYMKVPETVHAWRVMKDWIKVQPIGFNRLTAALQLVLQNFSGAGHHGRCNVVALAIFAIIGTATWLRLRRQMFAGRRLLLWLLFAGACAGPLVFDLVMHTYTANIPRYAIAALPIACLLAGEAVAGLSYPTRLLFVVLILLAWAPNSLIDYRTAARLSPRHRAEMVSAKEMPTDLLIINAAGGGVLSIVRYLKGPAPIVTWLPVWVPQPTRRIPDSIREFAAGRTRILWLAAAGSPNVTPERDWLRANSLVFQETKIFSDFRPKDSPTF